MSPSQSQREAFCRALPKVELHAHLTGSISRQQLHKIWLRKTASGEISDADAIPDPLVAIPPAADGINISTFFPIFTSLIYRLITGPEDVHETTLDVLATFARDGVYYIELRTTPRATAHMSARRYVQQVLDTIAEHNAENAPAKASLILSVDRRGTTADAEATVDMALDFRHLGVVGVDLCGDPTKGEVGSFRDAFARAKRGGLGLTLHFGELAKGGLEAEQMELLSWGPDRLGHVAHLSSRVREEVVRRGCGLELCLSCNVLAAMTRGGYSGHHFGGWWGLGVDGRRNSLSLGTDDVGIFEKQLSEEHALAMEHFGLGEREMIEFGRQSVRAIFADQEEKERLDALFDHFAEAHGRYVET